MVLILIFALILFIILSGLCSGCETGVYRISKVNLRINAEHGKPMSLLLSKMLEDTNSVIFSILIANNLCNFITTTIATYLFAAYYKGEAEYYVTVFITPILFIFGEVVPKNIFYLRADALMSIITLPLWALHKLLCITGITPLLKYVSNRFSMLSHSPSTSKPYTNIRSTIDIISDETKQEGLLSKVQRDIMTKMTNISSTAVSEVMMPINQVVMVDVNAQKSDLINTLKAHPFTRVLVYEGGKKNIIGYVNIYKAINDTGSRTVRELTKSIQSFPSQTTVITAIKIMSKQKLPIALVTRNGHNLGIITIKDLAEELTGELSVC